MSRFYWLLLVVGVLLSACGGLLLKMGAVEMNYNKNLLNIMWQLCRNGKIMLGMVCYFIPVLIWIYMLKRVELSFLQPLFSMVYIITPLLAIYFLHEAVPPARWIGIAIIISGIFVFARA